MTTGKQRRNLAQRVALHVFIVAACAMLAASEYWSIRDARTAALRTAQTSSLNLASSLAQHTSDSFEIAESVLSGIVDRVETSADQEPQALHQFLVEEANRSDRLHAIFVYDADGRWVNSSLAGGPRHHNNSDRAYFKHHKSHGDSLPFVGSPIRSRSDGSWIITLTKRINNPDGSFGGVALASIRLQYFRDFHSTFNVGRHGSIGIVHDDGTVVSRHPDDENVSGSNIAGTQIYQAMHTLRRGWAMYRSPVDGVERISGFAQARPFSLSVLAGVSSDEVLAPWRQLALHRATIAIAGCALLLGLGIWLDLQLRRMHASQTKLSTEAWIDPLTGIYNRRGFDYKMQRALQQGDAARSPVSMLMIDVDHFKLYNDAYGHVNGDACLQRVGQALASCALRLHDAAARYGGEEFALILPFTDEKGAEQLAQQVLAAVRELALPHASSPTDTRVTVSIGIACVDLEDQRCSVADLVARADAALYQAKQAGRNRACIDVGAHRRARADAPVDAACVRTAPHDHGGRASVQGLDASAAATPGAPDPRPASTERASRGAPMRDFGHTGLLARIRGSQQQDGPCKSLVALR
ncbi:GGDEF domain-containing protein [Xanthomonas sp. AmX2]|uniref:sensor domain-containing diguanylate cyclase n=1 Tax=Xanthomonas sp. TaxID=29446 RepID=UPI00197FD0A1|nr:sensor domain-containing diguanylate cyclase [Xanthomonas sp.]MBN6151958.1 GGDEF domain-containing protein [Xanthomonas sp.]